MHTKHVPGVSYKVRQFKTAKLNAYIFILLHVGTYCSELHKMVYLQNRRFLPMDSVLRKDTKQFPSKTSEVRDAPPMRVYETVKDCHKAYDLAPTK